ncbi:transposase [Kitasatospora sp. NPDC018614]|uniref:transposase n=1 Tax=unclassified Kitasatospora TaxID=2633591 RepID=UPI0037A9FAAE
MTIACFAHWSGHGAGWERLRPFLSDSNRGCGRWRDHRQVIDGILHRMRTGVQWREADAADDIDRDARTGPPPALAAKGAGPGEHQGETPWQSLVARLVEVVLEARAWAARAAGSPPRAT